MRVHSLKNYVTKVKQQTSLKKLKKSIFVKFLFICVVYQNKSVYL